MAARTVFRLGGIILLVAALVSTALPASAASRGQAGGHSCCTGPDHCSSRSATMACCKSSPPVPPATGTSPDHVTTDSGAAVRIHSVPVASAPPSDTFIHAVALERMKAPPHPAYLLNSVFLV